MSSNITKAFQERLEDLTNELKVNGDNITFRKISSETGISTGALSKYMNDEGEAGIDNLVKLANYFNVSTEYLLGLSDVKTTNTTVREMCEYTGLDENAVQELNYKLNDGTKSYMDYLIHLEVMKAFNQLINEDVVYELSKKYYFIDKLLEAAAEISGMAREVKDGSLECSVLNTKVDEIIGRTLQYPKEISHDDYNLSYALERINELTEKADIEKYYASIQLAKFFDRHFTDIESEIKEDVKLIQQNIKKDD